MLAAAAAGEGVDKDNNEPWCSWPCLTSSPLQAVYTLVGHWGHCSPVLWRVTTATHSAEAWQEATTSLQLSPRRYHCDSSLCDLQPYWWWIQKPSVRITKLRSHRLSLSPPHVNRNVKLKLRSELKIELSELRQSGPSESSPLGAVLVDGCSETYCQLRRIFMEMKWI